MPLVSSRKGGYLDPDSGHRPKKITVLTVWPFLRTATCIELVRAKSDAATLGFLRIEMGELTVLDHGPIHAAGAGVVWLTVSIVLKWRESKFKAEELGMAFRHYVAK